MPSNSDSRYDISSIQVAGWRKRYQSWLDGFQKTGQDLTQAYDLNGKPIIFEFEAIGRANATAAKTKDAYLVRMAHVFPYLLQGLFQRLLSDPDVLPWLPVSNDAPTSHPVKFVVSPTELQEQDIELPVLTEARNHAAIVMAEIAINFVAYHEFGHVLSGHLDVPVKQGGLPELSEFNLVSKSRFSDLWRCWEVDADIVGARLLQNFVTTTIDAAKDADGDSTIRQVFGPPVIAPAQVIAMATISLYVLFRFLGETRHRLELNADHPDPIVRAFIIRNALIPHLRGRYAIDDDLFDDILTARFEEFDDALEACGIHSVMTADDTGLESVNDAVSDLLALRRQHMNVAEPYAYIEWPK